MMWFLMQRQVETSTRFSRKHCVKDATEIHQFSQNTHQDAPVSTRRARWRIVKMAYRAVPTRSTVPKLYLNELDKSANL
jgi:hypothetical protein